MHADLSLGYTTAIIKKAGFLVSEAELILKTVSTVENMCWYLQVTKLICSHFLNILCSYFKARDKQELH